MTKEEIEFLTPQQKEVLEKRWKYWWKRTQPKDGYSSLFMREQMDKFLKAQPKP